MIYFQTYRDLFFVASCNAVGDDDIVYMGPVTLNKDNLINKAGIEVDVIPIMRSPCASPTPKKKKSTKRAKSEMGFHRSKRDKLEVDRGSLPDLQRSKSIPIKGSILGTIMHLKPERFLSRSLETGSTDSLVSSIIESTHSFGSTESLSKGAITNAVVNWLHKSSPFASSDNLEQHSCSTSMLDPMDTSTSIFDDEESVSSSIPMIFVSEEEPSKEKKKEPHVRRHFCTVEQTPLGK